MVRVITRISGVKVAPIVLKMHHCGGMLTLTTHQGVTLTTITIKTPHHIGM